MPSSYLASKPAPNPQQLSGFLTWTKHDFAAIRENSNVIAALVGIDSKNDLVVIFAPVPIQSPAGDLIAIAGNMYNDRSEPAFIKINKECIGHSYVIQNHMEIPLAIRPKIPLPAELLCGTSWNKALEELGIAAFPTMVPIPFGAVIPEGITPGDEFINVFGAISAEHGEWAKLITDQIKQSESDNNHVTIYRHIMEARVLRGERDPPRMATAGIRTIVIPTKSPFIETTRIRNRFPEALAILGAVFVQNPMPARVEFGASDSESYPEVNIGVQPNRQAQPNQQPPAPQQQHRQPAQMPQLPPQLIQQPGITVGPPPAAMPQ